MSDESDPSDDDQLAERAIDPLADLREELQEDATDQAADDTADTQSSTTAEQPPVTDSASSTEQQSTDGPLGELASAVSTRTDKTDAELEELFEQQETASVDPDAVWEQLEADDTSEADETPVQTEPRIVEKATYCETCPYFSAPPDMYCTHDGTEIRRLVDFDHVEVVNCPIVKQNDELENA